MIPYGQSAAVPLQPVKTVTVKNAASGAETAVPVTFETTPRSIKESMGLDETYFLTPGRGQEAFGDDEPIYNKVQHGSTLYAATPVEVGTYFSRGKDFTAEDLEKVNQLLRSFPNSRQQFVRPSLRNDGYWQQRGWQKRGNECEGYYRTMVGSWKGRAKVSSAGECKMYIHQPPKWLREHDHWVCFHFHGKGWYFIHTNNTPELSSGIIEVERLLTEASRDAR